MKTLVKNIAVLLMLVSQVAGAQQMDSSSAQGDRKPMGTAFHYPAKKFFFQGEVIGGYAEIGGRIVGGYRFGQFGMLGVGAGVDDFYDGFQSTLNSDPFSGIYFPHFVHYSGDILKRPVTPFYTIEAGYAFRYSNDNSYISVTPLNHPVYQNNGGFMGTASFGVKLYSKHKVYACWSAGLDIKQARDKYSNYYYNSIGENIKVSYSSSSFFFMPVLKIAVGF